MLPYDDLPMILVSALDTTTASSFISELIDEEETDLKADREDAGDRVWRLRNKYYSAEVRLHPVGDSGGPSGAEAGRVEAHLVHVAAGEGEREARDRWARAQRWGAAPAVAVAAIAAAEVSPALARWAAAHRLDAVPLLERAPPAVEGAVAGPFEDSYGVQRVRDALHAHVWRGLRRHRTETGEGEGAEGSGEGDEDEAEEDEGEGAVERAEAFALALGALGDARASPADDAVRRQRAEDVVAAFARALGLRLPHC